LNRKEFFIIYISTTYAQAARVLELWSQSSPGHQNQSLAHTGEAFFVAGAQERTKPPFALTAGALKSDKGK